MSKPNFYCSSDYAGLSCKNGSFYYGYEYSVCLECGKMTKEGHEYCDICEDADREWCFVAKINREEIVIPFSKLGTDNMFNLFDCLITGIGWILTKYRLVLNE